MAEQVKLENQPLEAVSIVGDESISTLFFVSKARQAGHSVASNQDFARIHERCRYVRHRYLELIISRAQVRRRLCGARWSTPIWLAYRFTLSKQISGANPRPSSVLFLQIRLNTIPHSLRKYEAKVTFAEGAREPLCKPTPPRTGGLNGLSYAPG
jgi:hypothetical protein